MSELAKMSENKQTISSNTSKWSNDESLRSALNTALQALRIVADRRGFTSRGLSFPFERDGQLHKHLLDAIRTAREALQPTPAERKRKQ